MKLTTLTSALAAVLGLIIATAPVTAHAQATATTTPTGTTTAPAKTKKAKSDNTQIPKGSTITSIDASSVVLKTASGDLTLAVTATTKFEFGTSHKNTPATAADFAAGDKVTGSYIKNADGTNALATLRKKAAK